MNVLLPATAAVVVVEVAGEEVVEMAPAVLIMAIMAHAQMVMLVCRYAAGQGLLKQHTPVKMLF